MTGISVAILIVIIILATTVTKFSRIVIYYYNLQKLLYKPREFKKELFFILAVCIKCSCKQPATIAER